MPEARRSAVRRILNPKSIAVVGASADLSRLGGRLLHAMLRVGANRRIYPVNPHHRELAGLPCFGDLSALPERPDAVVIALNASATLAVLEEGAGLGIDAYVLLAGGFAEVGSQGRLLQTRLESLCKTHGLYALGPNTVGLVNFVEGFACSFNASVVEGDLISGRIALLSQSGALAGGSYALAREQGVGFSHMLSTGNEAVLDIADFGNELVDDARVDVFALYIETIRDGPRFIDFLERSREAGKPVVVLAAGRSDVGQSAVRSHTGALATSPAVLRAVLARVDAIQVDTPEELVDFAVTLVQSTRPLGTRVAILSGSGGIGAVLADRCVAHGLSVPGLAEATRTGLREVLPEFAQVGNPTDITPEPFYQGGTIDRAVSLIASDPGIDFELVYLQGAGSWSARVAHELALGATSGGVYVGVIWGGIPDDARATLRSAGVHTFTSLERAVRAVGAVGRWNAAVATLASEVQAASSGVVLDLEAARRILETFSARILTEVEGKAFLDAAGLSGVYAPVLITDPKWIRTAIVGVRYPAVAKVVSRDVGHKSDIGGVILGLDGPEAVEAACRKLFGSAHAIDGVLVEPMAAPGIEVLVGTRSDPTFGPCIVVGSGGIHTEVLGDIALTLAPVDSGGVRELLASTKIGRVVAHIRDGRGYDIDALCEFVAAVSKLADAFGPEIAELDLNPVVVHTRGDGLTVLDCLLVRAEPTQTGQRSHQPVGSPADNRRPISR